MTEIQRQGLQLRSIAEWRSRMSALIVAAAFVGTSAACTGSCGIGSVSGGIGSAASAEPWGTNAVTPADFAKELAGAPAADRPVVVCTAPEFLYRVGHIPGAVFHGPASSPEGLSDLTAWAQALPRSTNIVIYCGCCPLSDCPNLRPSYAALKGLGFTRVRVLLIPENFKIDWVDRGYPFER